MRDAFQEVDLPRLVILVCHLFDGHLPAGFQKRLLGIWGVSFF